MSPGRCISGSASLGCYNNVTGHIRSECDGKQECRIFVSSLGQQLTTCPRDLMFYLYVHFTCVEGNIFFKHEVIVHLLRLPYDSLLSWHYFMNINNETNAIILLKYSDILSEMTTAPSTQELTTESIICELSHYLIDLPFLFSHCLKAPIKKFSFVNSNNIITRPGLLHAAKLWSPVSSRSSNQHCGGSAGKDEPESLYLSVHCARLLQQCNGLRAGTVRRETRMQLLRQYFGTDGYELSQ